MFSDSALKVVFTTLYVDIKEPAAWARLQPTKKLNPVFRSMFAPLNAERDKPGQNRVPICSPKFRPEPTLLSCDNGVPLQAGSAT